jgi:hypothetical protein
MDSPADSFDRAHRIGWWRLSHGEIFTISDSFFHHPNLLPRLSIFGLGRMHSGFLHATDASPISDMEDIIRAVGDIHFGIRSCYHFESRKLFFVVF